MPFRQNRNTITTKVVGGLGNQLFCYFAGLNLALLRDADLIVDVSDLKNGLSAHNVSLESLTLVGKFESKNFYNSIFARAVNKTHRVVFNKIYSRRNYFSPTVGYDAEVLKLDIGTHLNGYFQTYRYFNNVKNCLTSIEIKMPSRKYLETKDYFEKYDVLSIHVRRGDYVKHKSLYGLLGKEYYVEAINKLLSTNPNLKVWIFSDEVYAARELLEEIVPLSSVWVQPDAFDDDAEVLLTMSKSKALIIANSTFSWWAATLSNNDALVVAPSNWYQGMKDPEDLIPDSWIRVESYWE